MKTHKTFVRILLVERVCFLEDGAYLWRPSRRMTRKRAPGFQDGCRAARSSRAGSAAAVPTST